MRKNNLLQAFLRVLTLAVSLLLLLACVGHYWLFWPLLDLLSIFVPVLWATCGLVALYWLYAKWRRALLPAFALLISLLCFPIFYRLDSDAREGSQGANLRVASYNLGRISWPGSDPELQQARLQGILDSLDASVICFQEMDRQLSFEIRGYPYRYAPVLLGKADQAILSEYPIVASGIVEFPDSANNAIYADIAVPGDTIRIYNVHLQSYRIRSGRYLLRDFGKPFLRRIAEVAGRHTDQASRVKAHQEASVRRGLICGDFNSTAFSHTYRILRRGLKDTFSESGRGLGSSYALRGIPFRIDYILADPAFEVLDHRTYEIRLSDHYPVSATLRLQGE